MATKGKQRSSCNVYAVGTKGNCFDDISTGTDAASGNYGNIVTYALVTKTLVNTGKGQLNRYADMVAYACWCRPSAASESV
jgi:hypothetical protein